MVFLASPTKNSFRRKQRKSKARLARVMVSVVSTYGGLLKDEDLEFRVITLEEHLKNSLLILNQWKRKNEYLKQENA